MIQKIKKFFNFLSNEEIDEITVQVYDVFTLAAKEAILIEDKSHEKEHIFAQDIILKWYELLNLASHKQGEITQELEEKLKDIYAETLWAIFNKNKNIKDKTRLYGCKSLSLDFLRTKFKSIHDK